MSSMVIVGMVQINNSFAHQDYLPLAIGFLMSYAQKNVPDIDSFEFIVPIHKRIPVEAAILHLNKVDILAMSLYVWNFRLSAAIGRRIKEVKPETTIIVGGCYVPESNTEKFLRQNEYVDFAVTGEGEIAFASILKNYYSRNWTSVPSLHYIDDANQYVRTSPSLRIEDLNLIPSPYLGGVFKPLMDANSDVDWIGLWETNRGCSFKCSFCDWGAGSKNRMSNYSIERLYSEIDWFTEANIKFVYCCDANFGLYKDRDLEITMHFAENKRKYGCPEAFSVQNTKNSTEASYNIQKILDQNGLSKGVPIAFQSLHLPTIKAIKRGNIKLETFFELQKKFTEDGIKTFSDIIIGLPEETYKSFTEGVSTLVSLGQHNRIQFNNLSILANSEMGDLAYQSKYGMEVVEARIINIHGKLNSSDMVEMQRLSISTSTMPRKDWVRARSFAFMIALLHFDKILQVPFVILNHYFSINYEDIIERFLNSSQPIIEELSNFFFDKARAIQKGDVEYCESKEWLNIWWPADELMFINLVTQGKLHAFYQESKELLIDLAGRNGAVCPEGLIEAAIDFNKCLLKMPYLYNDMVFNSSFNIGDMYQGSLVSSTVAIEEGFYQYHIQRSEESWNSWEDWCKLVVWYGNKKGAYLYNYGG